MALIATLHQRPPYPSSFACRAVPPSRPGSSAAASLAALFSIVSKEHVYTATPAQVGYMGVPYQKVDMTSHAQYLHVRNERGQEMLDAVSHRLEVRGACLLELHRFSRGQING